MKVILALSALGIIVLFAELFRFKKALFPIVILGILASLAAAISYWKYTDGALAPYFSGMVDAHHHIPDASLLTGPYSFAQMINFDHSSILITSIMLVTALLWFVMAKGFFKDESSSSDKYSLIIFSLVGAVVLSCYSNMAMLFLGVEILSIPLYVLAGSNKSDLNSNESAFKYFLLGSFASAFLLFGIAMLYGATRTFDLKAMSIAVNSGNVTSTALLYGGIILLLVGLLFKIGAAPFHFWTPDVYQGAPTQVTAFMSTVVKTAAIVAIMRLFLTSVFGGTSMIAFWSPLLAVCIGLTFFIGNIAAVAQDRVKRMLAFSSISHAGFLLLAVLAVKNFSAKAIVYYVSGYSIASIAAFTVLLNIMDQTGSDSVDNFNGLGKKNPMLAVAMTIALFSLAGIPPTAGFFGKYYVLNAALINGNYWLAIFGILGSLVGVYYYFRIIIAMYFKESKSDVAINAGSTHQALLFVTAVATLVLGLLPDLLLNIGTDIASASTVIQP
ncbi:MAG TPA: NADH-quinone oxidoreductase subunit N [Bacteroidia bacterium]|jgi:NADH-quinone oxidoreductase subunit N|nr:NADH-quinone oxidoreductase subunit N [Bacteroidia bacterium]